MRDLKNEASEIVEKGVGNIEKNMNTLNSLLDMLEENVDLLQKRLNIVLTKQVVNSIDKESIKCQETSASDLSIYLDNNVYRVRIINEKLDNLRYRLDL